MTRAKSHPYTVVDVFTTEPLAENSLPVIPEASDVDAAAMHKIARELSNMRIITPERGRQRSVSTSP